MMKIKFWIVTLSLCLITNLVHAQSGFHVIKKAERKYEAGKEKAALRLLNRAEKLDYGFCGNSWIGANRSICLLKARIYMDSDKYLEARNSLNSILWEHEDDNLDSIRIRTYQLQFGKMKVSEGMDLALKNAYLESDESDCYVIMPMNGLACDFRFKMNPMNSLFVIAGKDKYEELKSWIEEFHSSGNYKLAKEL